MNGALSASPFLQSEWRLGTLTCCPSMVGCQEALLGREMGWGPHERSLKELYSGPVSLLMLVKWRRCLSWILKAMSKKR
ncbi:unnamed protein product [Caretta caretta]